MGLLDGNVALVTGGTSGIGRAKRNIALLRGREPRLRLPDDESQRAKA